MQKIEYANILRGLRLVHMLDFDPNCSIGPLRVDIAATSACNYRCVFCGSHSYLMKQPVKPETLNPSRLIDLLAELKKLGTTEILFAGNGEPLLSNFLTFHLCRYDFGLKIEVMTNGSLLDKVDQEVFSKLSKLIVSLNSGNGKSHQITHGYQGVNQFPTITDNIKRLLGCPGGPQKIELNYVVTKDNQNELEDFKTMAESWGVKYHARSVDARMFQALSLPDAVIDKSLNPCYLAFIQPTITAEGEVRQCCGCEPVGNIYRDSFTTIWKRSREQRFKAATMRQPVVPGCYGCTNAIASSRSFHSMYTRIPLLGRWVHDGHN